MEIKYIGGSVSLKLLQAYICLSYRSIDIISTERELGIDRRHADAPTTDRLQLQVGLGARRTM